MVNRASVSILSVKEPEHLKRIVQPERKKRWKSINPKDVLNNEPELKIIDPNLLELDISDLEAHQVARRINDHVNKRR